MEIRMFWLPILSILSVICTLGAENIKKYPFCSLEPCQCKTKTVNSIEIVDVECGAIKDVDLFDPSFWIDSKTNLSYPYDSVTLADNEIINLAKTIPSSNVTYLNLANNDLCAVGNNVFENLQKMQVLILSHNDLELIHPDAFSGLVLNSQIQPLDNLKELRLDHNKLHTLNSKIFYHALKIEILDLSFNPIVTIDQNTLSAITSLALLKELYLQYTEIKTLPDTMLHTPKYLSTLDLSGNPITTMPTTLQDTHNLTHLYMNNTEFVNLTEKNGFPKIPSLKVLHLCQNEFLTKLGRRSLTGLTNLEELRICNNNVLSEIDPLVLAFPQSESGANVWPNIKKLYLQNNKLAYIDSDIIARWDVLSELDIRGNPWTCECENQWLIEDLMPIYLRIDPEGSKEVKCGAPIEMEKFTFYELYKRKSHMRCLDYNGAHPENDALILVGILAGVLITIPATLFLIMGYRRRWYTICGICDKSPGAYSRRFYSASATEDFYKY